MQRDVMQAPENVPQHIQSFYAYDFSGDFIWYSDLLMALIKGHYVLLESSGNKSAKMYELMNKSSDYLVANLKQDKAKFEIVTELLFNLLRKRSLHKATGHLSP